MDERPSPAEPLDDGDPRFGGPGGGGSGGRRVQAAGGFRRPAGQAAGGSGGRRERELVRSQGPGLSPMSPHARILRVAFPLLFLAGVSAIAAVFMRALDEGPPQPRLGPAGQVRAAAAARPRRICIREDASPCAWITVVDGEPAAFDTNGPPPQEYGRFGVSWCPASGRYGANATGSRWEAAGNVARGPAPRGLGRTTVQYGTFRVGLQGETDAGAGSAVAVGDIVLYTAAASVKIDKDTSGVRFGYAEGTVGSAPPPPSPCGSAIDGRRDGHGGRPSLCLSR